MCTSRWTVDPILRPLNSWTPCTLTSCINDKKTRTNPNPWKQMWLIMASGHSYKYDVTACGFCKNRRSPDPPYSWGRWRRRTRMKPVVSAIWRVGRVYTVYNPCSFPGKRWSIGSCRRTWKNQNVLSKGIERGESAPSPSYFAVLRRKTARY
jgi:hypothetical protein